MLLIVVFQRQSKLWVLYIYIYKISGCTTLTQNSCFVFLIIITLRLHTHHC